MLRMDMVRIRICVIGLLRHGILRNYFVPPRSVVRSLLAYDHFFISG